MNENDKKVSLPWPVKLFFVSLVLGVLTSPGSLNQYIENYLSFLGAPYEWVGILDLVLWAANLVVSIAMLVEIGSRNRIFFLFLWIYLLLRSIPLLTISFLGGSITSSFATLLVAILWTVYFHLSKKVAAVFSLKCTVSPSETEPPENPACLEDTHQKYAGLQKKNIDENQFSTDECIEDKVLAPCASIASDPTAANISDSAQPDSDLKQPVFSSSPSSKHRFCRYCGTMYGPNDSHCPGCGRRVRFILRIPFDFPFSSPQKKSVTVSHSASQNSFFRSRSFMVCILLGVLTVFCVFSLTALWEFIALGNTSASPLYKVTISFENSQPQRGKEYYDEISLDDVIFLKNGDTINFSPDLSHEIRFASERTFPSTPYPDKGLGFYTISPSEFSSGWREISFECSASMKEWSSDGSNASHDYRYKDSYTRTANISLSAVLPSETAQQISFVRNSGLILCLILTLLFFIFSYRRFYK